MAVDFVIQKACAVLKHIATTVAMVAKTQNMGIVERELLHFHTTQERNTYQSNCGIMLNVELTRVKQKKYKVSITCCHVMLNAIRKIGAQDSLLKMINLMVTAYFKLKSVKKKKTLNMIYMRKCLL